MAGQQTPEPKFPSRPLDLVEQIELAEWDTEVRRVSRAPRGEKERRLRRLRARVHARLAEQLPKGAA